MSDIAITVQTVREIETHPNADRLEIIKILGTQCITGIGDFQVGEKVMYFPPDMMIPETVAEELGVKNYLKHVKWNGKKVQSRIAACRLRGVPSYGFATACRQGFDEGFDATLLYFGEKYEPPIMSMTGVGGGKFNTYALPEGKFHQYTNIQHLWRFPGVFGPDEDIVITEKIHGTNSRLGVLNEDGWVFAAGSHRVRWQDCSGGDRYWKPLTENMMAMLNTLCGECSDVIVFGEIFGSSVQDMDYGIPGDEGYQVFDISINGVYLDWPDVVNHCIDFDIPTVPVLYRGPWKCVSGVLDEYASGLSSAGEHSGKFKGREGVVIKPVQGRMADTIGGRRNAQRAILKYVSADYYDRKGAQDNE